MYQFTYDQLNESSKFTYDQLEQYFPVVVVIFVFSPIGNLSVCTLALLQH